MLAAWRRSLAASSRNLPNLLSSPQLCVALLPALDNAFTRPSYPGAPPDSCAAPRVPGSAAPCRPIFSLPGFDDDLAKKYHERKLMGYSPQQMFSVVADVDEYHRFVPWCQRSSVVHRTGDTYLEAELEVGFQIFVEKYLSKVTLKPCSMVSSHVGDSALFSHLDSSWRFRPGPTPQSVWLSFDVDFAFKSPLYRKVASLFFEEVVQRMMSAFEGRCTELYGPSSLQRGHPRHHRRGPAGAAPTGQ